MSRSSPFFQMVQIESGGLQVTFCKTDSDFSYICSRGKISNPARLMAIELPYMTTRARDGPDSVSPVFIQAMALDRSLKEDRTLCPVRALHYYLDKTKDLREDKELVFVSFKKIFTKDIVPATISSWIKQYFCAINFWMKML